MTSDAAVMTAKPDFPDWLSPMLVKELRQGMRSRAFLFSFLAVQAAMMFLGLMGLLNSADGSTDWVTTFFWIITGVPLLFIMPFSGLGSISSEKTANTLDLIFLTKLTARRIVFGKWVAIVAQTLLLVSAILPYAVMRYYLGGVNIAGELKTLAWMLAGSALLTSIMVGLSPLLGRVGRAIFPFALFILLSILLPSLFNAPMSMFGWGWDWRFILAMGLQIFCLVLLMLEVGAGKIAPVAENHSTPRRLIALLSILTALVYSFVPAANGIIWTLPIFFAAPALIGAVCEPVREVPSIYRPFLRFGFPGRALGRLLYPGWPAGVLFSLLLLVAVELRIDQIATGPHQILAMHNIFYAGTHYRQMVISRGLPQSPSPGLVLNHILFIRIQEVSYLGAFFLPVAILRLIRLKHPHPAVLYFALQGTFAFLSLIGYLTSEYGSDRIKGIRPHDLPGGLEELIACIPTSNIFLQGRIRDWDLAQLNTVLWGVSILTLGAIVICLLRSIPAWRAIRALEKTAATITPVATPSADVAGPVPAA
jgi:hypothetical protein